ncbi:MAG: NADH-quinone oxidoreductase subunit M [Pseudomonadota bacterium]
MDCGVPMIPAFLVAFPLVAGIACWSVSRKGPQWARVIALAALVLEMALVIGLWIAYAPGSLTGREAQWFLKVDYAWIPELGIGFRLAVDGLSLIMTALTLFLGIAAVLCSWTEIRDRIGFFHFNLMAALAGIIGVFLATDFILFYFFWEVMLVPMYLLIGIWGHENRTYAAIKFFIFTQAGGLLMLAAMLGLYFVHGNATGTYTFDYFTILESAQVGSSLWLMLGFFAAFAVKLPMVPFHTWLPDAHTEAPTAGSVILAGLLLKTGGYGLIRFVLPLFPDAVALAAPWATALGCLGIIYGAVLAFAQEDVKRLVAYSSVSHLGFVVLGVFSRTEIGLQGAVVQMVCHGISTGALFIIVGMVQERLHTRQLDRLGGLWADAPLMGGSAMVFALASLGLPGLGNFVGELLVLAGTFQVNKWAAVVAASGLTFAAIYSLWLIRRMFHGPRVSPGRIADLNGREMALSGAMIAVIVWLGVFPSTLTSTAGGPLGHLGHKTTSADAKVISQAGPLGPVRFAPSLAAPAPESREVPR